MSSTSRFSSRRDEKHAYEVAIDQQLGHHPRVIWRIVPLLSLIMALVRAQVQMVDQATYEMRQMIFRKPLPQTRRELKLLLRKVAGSSSSYPKPHSFHSSVQP